MQSVESPQHCRLSICTSMLGRSSPVPQSFDLTAPFCKSSLAQSTFDQTGHHQWADLSICSYFGWLLQILNLRRVLLFCWLGSHTIGGRWGNELNRLCWEETKGSVMAQSESNMPFFKKWELAMQKLLGVELQKVISPVKSSQIQSNPVKSNQIKSNQIKSNQIKSNQIKVWLCWTIFVIKIVCAPLNLIFGGIFYNESSEQPHLPPLMIAGGLLEVACPAFLWWNTFPSGKRENILKLSALTGALGPSCLLLICDASLQEGELILWCPVRCTEHKLRKALQNRKNFVGSSFQHPHCNSQNAWNWWQSVSTSQDVNYSTLKFEFSRSKVGQERKADVLSTFSTSSSFSFPWVLALSWCGWLCSWQEWTPTGWTSTASQIWQRLILAQQYQEQSSMEAGSQLVSNILTPLNSSLYSSRPSNTMTNDKKRNSI